MSYFRIVFLVSKLKISNLKVYFISIYKIVLVTSYSAWNQLNSVKLLLKFLKLEKMQAKSQNFSKN